MSNRCMPGSEIFGTSVVKTDEYILMAETMKEGGANAEEIFVSIWAIDEMLQMQKLKSIHQSQRFTKTGMIRKNSNFSDWISTRMDALIDDLNNCKST